MSGRATVIAEYSATDRTIALSVGDVVDIVQKNDKWWYVRCEGKKGYYPASCMKELPEEILPPGWVRCVSHDNSEFYSILLMMPVMMVCLLQKIITTTHPSGSLNGVFLQLPSLSLLRRPLLHPHRLRELRPPGRGSPRPLRQPRRIM
jgi:hypothetical protein